MSWWQTYFDEAFFQLHEDLFPEADSRREVAAALEMCGVPYGARILDVPCGWGRHTQLFAEAGLASFGADLSLPLLQRAVAVAHEDSLEPVDSAEPVHAANDVDPEEHAAALPHYAAADVRALPYRSGSFDVVVNLFTSLGLFLNDADDIRALREAARVLRPGGVFLLESMHRDEVIADYAERDEWTLPNGTTVQVRRKFDPVTGISRERLRWQRGDESGEKRHALRLRTATEIDALLRAAGFQTIQYYGDWNGMALRHDAPRVIAVASARDQS